MRQYEQDLASAMDFQRKTRTMARDAEQERADNGQFGSGGSSSGSEKQKISTKELKTKLESMSHADLTGALNNKDVDPAVKKHVEKELDSRANRGTSKGFGEK